MRNYYKNVCETVLKFKDYRDGLMRKTVISLIPVLAEFDDKEFVANYVHKSMLYLLSQLKKDRDRSICWCFCFISKLSIALANIFLLTFFTSNLSLFIS